MLRINTYISESVIHGIGLFAAEPVSAGTVIWRFDPPFDVTFVKGTLGVLPALASVLEDSGTRDLAVEFPDIPTRKEFLEARKRAVGSLLNLSMAQENRLAVNFFPSCMKVALKKGTTICVSK